MKKGDLLWSFMFSAAIATMVYLILKLKTMMGIDPEGLSEESVVALKESVRGYILAGGLLSGIMLGAVLQRSMMCLVIACHDIVTFKDLTQMRAFAAAVFVAILGTQVLYRLGEVDISYSIYISAPFTPLSYVIGGFIFGFGIVLAGGCASRILVSTSEGNLSGLLSVMAFVFSSGATLWGITSWIRTDLIEKLVLKLPNQYLPGIISSIPWWAVLAAVEIMLLIFILRAPRHSEWWSWKWPLTAAAVGITIVLAWWLNGLGHRLIPRLDPFSYTGIDDPAVLQYWRPKSLTFALADAQTFRYLFLWTAEKMNFAIASVFGVVIGGFVSALSTRTFRLVAPDIVQFKNSLIGGTLMGFGAVVAMGCNIGQGLSGFSTLSLGSIITVVFIIVGALTGSYYMNWRIAREAGI